LPELAAGGNTELGEDLGQVVLDVRGLRNSWAAISGFDRPVRARPAIWASSGDEISARIGGAPAHGPAGGQQLPAGPLRECPHTDHGEHLVRLAQLRARLGPPALTAQPLAVEQVRAGELGTEAGAAQPAGRLAITALGLIAVAQQRSPVTCRKTCSPPRQPGHGSRQLKSAAAFSLPWVASVNLYSP